MMMLALAGSFQDLRDGIDATEARYPGYWQTTAGRLYLRIATNHAVSNKDMRVIQYMCEERGVPPMAVNRDEFGMYFFLAPSLLFSASESTSLPSTTSFPFDPLSFRAPLLIFVCYEGGLCILATPFVPSHPHRSPPLSLLIPFHHPQLWRCAGVLYQTRMSGIATGGLWKLPPEKVFRISACTC